MPVSRANKGNTRYGKDRGKWLFSEGPMGRESDKGAQALIKVSETLLETDGGAGTETATGAIPAGAQVIGVVGRVVTAVTGPGASFTVGDGTDADRWSGAKGLTAGTTWTQDDATADPAGTWAATARNVVLTANSGTFTAGQVRITVFYWDVDAATE